MTRLQYIAAALPCSLVPYPVMAIADVAPGTVDPGQWLHHHYHGFGHGGFGFLAFFIVMMVFVFFIFGGRRRWWPGPHGWHHHDGDSALEVLRTRYAKGEIDSKEFDERKKLLEP